MIQTALMDPISLIVFLLLWGCGYAMLWRIDGCPIPSDDRRPAPDRVVSVIVPARDESANLGALLESLKRQTVRAGETIVVDDHSTDDTCQVARLHGARVLNAEPLPDGWCGKPWACWQGAQHSSGEMLLFLDADTRLEPDGLHRLLAAQANGGGLLSVQPYHRMTQFYEQLAAFFNLISFGSLAACGLFDRNRVPTGAFGPCNLCSRTDYFATGGHLRAAGSVLESLPLAQAFAERGLPVRCLAGKGSVWFRMYRDGTRALTEGFGKGFAIGAGHLPLSNSLLTTGWLAAGFEPLRHLIQELAAGHVPGAIVWSGCYLLFAAQLYSMLIRIGNFRWSTALAYPIPLLFFMYVFARSVLMARFTGKVRWKGRTIGT